MGLLESIRGPADLRRLARHELPQLAGEGRQRLIEVVSQTGGHIGAGLGVVELTVALVHAFDSPRDRIVWDVGHQGYPWKILTGRNDRPPPAAGGTACPAFCGETRASTTPSAPDTPAPPCRRRWAWPPPGIWPAMT